MNKEELYSKMKGINDWIEQNPDVTEPNMYEMIDCMTNLGILAKEDDVANMPGKFPAPDSKLAEVYKQWNKMHKARMGLDKVNDPNFSVNKNTALYSYYMSLNMDCCTGEFVYPENEEERLEFLECLKKIGGVSLYINQEKLKNKDFQYDNKTEHDWTVQMSEKYSKYLPKETTKVLESIEENYVYRQNSDVGGSVGESDDNIR